MGFFVVILKFAPAKFHSDPQQKILELELAQVQKISLNKFGPLILDFKIFPLL